MRPIQWVLALVAAAALAAVFAAGYWFGRHADSTRETLPVLGTSPRYELVNQLGQTVSSERFLGRVQLVTFLSPYCTSYCPLIAFNLISLERVLEEAGLADRVQLVAFDVDPEHTGPATMAAFLEQYGWNPRDTRWQFLTGTPKQVRTVVTDGFFIDYSVVPEAQQAVEDKAAKREGRFVPQPEVANPLAARASPDYDVVHSDALVVVDPQGNLRVIYDQADRVSNAELMAVINDLLGTGGSPAAGSAAGA
jgi:protein SCO1/2